MTEAYPQESNFASYGYIYNHESNERIITFATSDNHGDIYLGFDQENLQFYLKFNGLSKAPIVNAVVTMRKANNVGGCSSNIHENIFINQLTTDGKFYLNRTLKLNDLFSMDNINDYFILESLTIIYNGGNSYVEANECLGLQLFANRIEDIDGTYLMSLVYHIYSASTYAKTKKEVE